MHKKGKIRKSVFFLIDKIKVANSVLPGLSYSDNYLKLIPDKLDL